jgi:tetratricopeptide (TPR) repeat protein
LLLAQGLDIPYTTNQKASVNQWIGLVEANVTYYSPNVIHPRSGEDRTGKIWGELVPYGFEYWMFAGKVIPWRAGAQQNTIFSISHDVKIEGQDLPAGKYGLFMAPGKEEWTIIFSSNSNSWGPLYYDEKEDVLRVTVKPAKTEFIQYLTYDFIERKSDYATLALKWEHMMVPFKIEVPNINELYIDKMRSDLRNGPGFEYRNWVDAVDFCVSNNINLEEALAWSDYAINREWFGTKNYATLSAKASVLEKLGREEEAEKLKKEAIKMATTKEVHQEGMQLISADKNKEALELFKFNANKFPKEVFRVNIGLAKGYKATGDKKKAIKHWDIALKNMPETIDYQYFMPRLEKELEELKASN